MVKLFLGGYIAFWIGLSVASVGDMPNLPLEPYSWRLPLEMIALIIPIAGLAYFAGKEDA